MRDRLSSPLLKKLTEIYPHNVLDVGTGITSLPQLIRNCGYHVTAIDNIRDYWPTGMVNRHYYVINDDITNTQLVKKFDLVTCVSVLEHIDKCDDAIRNMFSLLNPEGHLILTFPYTEKVMCIIVTSCLAQATDRMYHILHSLIRVLI
jgi:2-polyprenyl-3-methyl-5-hydroxy-6-metoxy-1,4-benzoquinol methylase